MYSKINLSAFRNVLFAVPSKNMLLCQPCSRSCGERERVPTLWILWSQRLLCLFIYNFIIIDINPELTPQVLAAQGYSRLGLVDP